VGFSKSCKTNAFQLNHIRQNKEDQLNGDMQAAKRDYSLCYLHISI